MCKRYYIFADNMFIQAFLLIYYYSFIYVQYFRCSDISYRNIFWQLVNKTADCFKNIIFILLAKISSKKDCAKIENNSTLAKVLLVCNRSSEMLRLVKATFDSKMASLRTMRKKNFKNWKVCRKKINHFLFYLFVVVDVGLQNINCKCWKNCNMVTERTYHSVVFKIFLNIITICIFIEQ